MWTDQLAGGRHAIENEWLRSMVNAVQDPIVLADEQNRVTMANVHATRLFKAGEDQSAECRRVVERNTALLVGALCAPTVADGVEIGRELTLVDPIDGRELFYEMTCRTAINLHTGERGRVAVLRNVTELHELERRRVEQQLFESEKLAAVGRLAAAVAHEINNPLEAIKNSLYLLVQQTPEGDPNRRFLEIANRETQRVSNVIRQMLGFSRRPAAAEAVDVNGVLDDACGLLDRQLRHSGIQLSRELDPRLPAVRGSADELSQVFLNLLLNAQHAMPDGGSLFVTSRVAGPADREFVSGSYVVVQIRDTGVGIPEDQLPHIFDPFYTTRTDSKGTGLGLWVSLGIVQSHGGQMQVRSWPGQGTTFTIALPVAEAQ